MSNINVMRKNLGPVTAYKYAVQQGYTGTEQEFAALMASYATVAEEAEAAKDDAVIAKTAAEEAQAAAEAAAEQAEGAIEVDDTLSVKGRAADAKAAGDEIRKLDTTVNGVVSRNYTEGKNFDANGNVVDDPGKCISEYIPYTWTGYAAYDCGDNTDKYYYVIFYDSEKIQLGGTFRFPINTEDITYRTINADTVVTAGTPAYVRFSFKKGEVGKIWLNGHTNYWISQSTTSGGLINSIGDLDNLDTTNKDNLVSAINETNNKIPSFPIEPENTSFFYISKNLINPADCVDGEYVNQTNGIFTSNPIHNRSGYIKVNENTEYILCYDGGSSAFRYAFYTDKKTYISGDLLPDNNDMILTSPANAAFAAVSIGTIKMERCMFAEYDGEDKTFAPYERYIYPEYIQNENISDLIINIPSKIYALVGYEVNIYFENITEEWEKYKWDVTCSKGMQLERGYRITPVAGDVGTYTLKIKASRSDTVSKEVTTTLVVTSVSAGTSATKSVIVLGDSTTNNGIAITKLNENFSTDVMGISTLGTRGTSPNNHEGRSGWRLETYFTVESVDYTDGRGHVENPFYNPTTQTFDADYYFTNSGIAKPDWFFINMGINDVFSYETGTALDSAIETCIGYVDSMIASVKSASPSSKIGVCLTIPPNHSQDAFGKAYSNGQTRHRYKKNNTIWVNRLIAEYDNRESESIYLIPIHTNLDTVYNMGMETLPVNARNTSVTYQSPISNGGVHPVESGYWQIADVYTAFLKAHGDD